MGRRKIFLLNLRKIPRTDKSGQYFETTFRRSVSPIVFERQSPKDPHNVAFVLQGPLVTEFDYTFLTAQTYLSKFPNAPIIVSTWQGSDPRTIKKLRNAGVIVVESDPEAVAPGLANANLQMVTSHAGLTAARELSAVYAIKTRTDQRIYNLEALEALPLLLKTFPIEGEANQRARLLVPSLNTFAYRLYGVTDMLMFGHIDDMEQFWDGHLDDRTEYLHEHRTLREYSKLRLAEVYFTSRFLENRGEKLEWTVRDYWEKLAARFLVVDAGFLDMHWPKYTNIENRWGSWRSDPKFAEVSFAMWLQIWSGTAQPDESVLDRH